MNRKRSCRIPNQARGTPRLEFHNAGLEYFLGLFVERDGTALPMGARNIFDVIMEPWQTGRRPRFNDEDRRCKKPCPLFLGLNTGGCRLLWKRMNRQIQSAYLASVQMMHCLTRKRART